MEILKFFARIRNLWKLRIPYVNYEKHANRLIICENHENHENLRIPCENQETYENIRIPFENYKIIKTVTCYVRINKNIEIIEFY